MSNILDKIDELIKIRKYINDLRVELRKDSLSNPRHIDIVCSAENHIVQEILNTIKRYCDHKDVTTK